MKRKISIILSALAVLFTLVSCGKQEGVEEAWPGEKTLENTVWTHFPEGSSQSDMYIVVWDYDLAVNMVVKNGQGAGISCTGKLLYQDSSREVTISGIEPRTEGESVPDKMTGSVSASGLRMEWSCDGVSYDCLFTYSCPADKLGTSL